MLTLPPVARVRTFVAAGAPVPATGPRPGTARGRRDTVAQLGTIIGPGADGHTYDWPGITASLGVAGLPSDFKRLAEAYGPAVINGIFVVDPDRFAESHETHAEYLRRFWAAEPQDAIPVHPEPGGLLLCAMTEGRDTLWWDTAPPDPDQWTITWDVEFDQHRFAGTLTELIIADLTGRLEPALTALDPSDDDPLFLSR